MECSPVGDGSSRPVTETGMLMFDWGSKRYQRTTKSLNANVYGQRQYMAFGDDSDKLKPHSAMQTASITTKPIALTG